MNQKAIISFFVDAIAKVQAIRIDVDLKHMDEKI